MGKYEKPEKADLGSLDGLLRSLAAGRTPELWRESWDAAVSSYPEDGIFFLNDDFILSINRYLSFPEEALKSFHDFFEAVKNKRELCVFLWLWHICVFKSGCSDFGKMDEWPLPETGIPSFRNMLPAVIAVSGVPYTVEFYRKKGIPSQILRDTLSELKNDMILYRRDHGSWGMTKGQLRWKTNHLSGRLYRFGRLSFKAAVFPLEIKVFRSLSAKGTAVLMEPGVEVRGDGLINGTNGVSDTAHGWVSRYREDENTACGNTIISGGYAQKRKVSLDRKEWIKLLERGDHVVEVHVPSGERLFPESYADSFRQASGFFERYFRERPFHAFSCWSWLLDPQLENLLPRSSNILKFQSLFHLFPVISTDSQIFDYVFKNETQDYESLPEKTSLQSSIKKYYLKGGRLHSGGGFLLKEDISPQPLSPPGRDSRG